MEKKKVVVKTKNPWIDPRLLRLRPEAVKDYLLSKGWVLVGPAKEADMLMFDTPQPRDDKPNVLLPLKLEHGHQIQRMIELVTELALYEDRYAPDVLDAIEQQSEPTGGPAISESPISEIQTTHTP